MCRTTAVALVLAALLALPVAAEGRAERLSTLEPRLQNDFPLLGAMLAQPASVPQAKGRFPAQVRTHSAAQMTSAGLEVLEAFPGVDILQRPSMGEEVLFVTSPESAAGIVYQVVDTGAFTELVNDGRGLRLIGRTAADDLFVSAPLVVDSAGRPSNRGRWLVERTANGPIFLRLDLGDRNLRYPVAVAHSTRGTLRPPTRVATDATGSVSGTVTDSASGAPVANGYVFVYQADGNFVDLAISDGSGAYSVGGLDTGSYVALISAEGFLPQLYAGMPCDFLACDVTTGTAIAVTDGLNTAGIDFPLTSDSVRIGGKVKDTLGNPLTPITVVIYDAGGVPVGSATTDGAGNYQVFLPAGGTFYARTINNTIPGLIDQIYSGINCNACDATAGTAMTLSIGGARNDVDFVLKAGGRIAGQVTDAATSAPLTANVVIYDASGASVSFANTENGNYVSQHGLLPGTYYVVASAYAYVPELYDNVICAGCAVTTGDPVTITGTNTAQNIDFALRTTEARASGRVTDATSLAPLGGILVSFHNAAGMHVASATTQTDGTYSLALPGAGTYFARTYTSAGGYVDQLYSGFDCSGCLVTSGTAISVTPGTPVEDIDFALSNNGGTISGQITSQASGLPVDFGYAHVYSANGEFVTYGYTDSNGNYNLVNTLTSGTYYIVGNASGYISELHDSINCQFGCDPTTGTGVQVTQGQSSSVNFALSAPGCSISLEPASLPNGAQGDAYSATFTSPDGSGQLSFNLTAGTLPNGLTLSPDGQLTGTLTTGGTFSFVVTVTDALGCSGGNSYTVVVTGTSAATSTSLAASPANPVYGQSVTLTATVTPADADGTVTFFVATSPDPLGSATLSGGTASITVSNFNAGTHGLTASYSGSESYDPSTGTLSLVVAKATPSITWPDPASITYGTALSATQLNATTNVPGTFVYSPAAGTVLNAGTHTLSVSFTPDDSANYNGASDTATLVVDKATPQLVWADPAPITYGTALSATQLNATANVAGTFTYSPAAGTILDAGTQTLSVSFTPSDSANYNGASASATLVVNKAAQQIVWADPASIIVGTPLSGTQLNATVVVPGPSPAGALTYNPPAGTVLSAGTHTLNVTAAATANYNSATASVSITVTYGFTSNALKLAKSGSVIPIKISLVDANGNNVSSASVPLAAYGVRLTSSGTWIPVTATGNPGTAFKFQIEGTYHYNLDTDGLAAGAYVFGFTIGNDPTVYTISFSIR